MEPELPTSIAGFCTKPDGTNVWIQTLTDPQRREVVRNTHLRTAKDMRPFRAPKKGVPAGELYDGMLAQIEEMSNEGQANYLATCEFKSGAIRDEAWEKYPELKSPERGEEDDAAWIERVEAYDTALIEAEEKRKAFVDEAIAKIHKDALALPAKVRRERCIEAAREREYMEVFGKWLLCETLLRAVRDAEATDAPFYASIQRVEADAKHHDLFWEFYLGLQPAPSAIPTTPPGSGD